MVKVFEILTEAWDKDFDQVPEKKLSNDKRWDLLKSRQRGFSHQQTLLREKERYVLKSLRKKGIIFNDDDGSFYSKIPEEQKDFERIRTMAGQDWYYRKDTPHMATIEKLKKWLLDIRMKNAHISTLDKEIERRLKGLRSARTRMGLRRRY